MFALMIVLDYQGSLIMSPRLFGVGDVISRHAWVEQDSSTIKLHYVGRGVHGGQHEKHVAVAKAELPGMAGRFHNVVLNDPVGQRSSAGRAAVIEGVEYVSHGMEDRDGYRSSHCGKHQQGFSLWDVIC